MQRHSFTYKFSLKRAMNVLLTGAVCAGLLSGCAAMPRRTQRSPGRVGIICGSNGRGFCRRSCRRAGRRRQLPPGSRAAAGRHVL